MRHCDEHGVPLGRVRWLGVGTLMYREGQMKEPLDCIEPRIRRDMRRSFDERDVVAWRAYLAGLLEWQVLDFNAYEELLELLPSVRDDPARNILRG